MLSIVFVKVDITAAGAPGGALDLDNIINFRDQLPPG